MWRSNLTHNHHTEENELHVSSWSRETATITREELPELNDTQMLDGTIYIPKGYFILEYAITLTLKIPKIMGGFIIDMSIVTHWHAELKWE